MKPPTTADVLRLIDTVFSEPDDCAMRIFLRLDLKAKTTGNAELLGHCNAIIRKLLEDERTLEKFDIFTGTLESFSAVKH